jgi:hypothetical protein
LPSSDPFADSFLGDTMTPYRPIRSTPIQSHVDIFFESNPFGSDELSTINVASDFIVADNCRQLSPLLYHQVNWFNPQLPVQHEPGPKVGKNHQMLWLKQLIGTFLYNARAVDPTILVEINKLASQQANDKTKELDDHLTYLQQQFLTPDSIVEISGKTMYKEFVSFHQLLKDKLK